MLKRQTTSNKALIAWTASIAGDLLPQLGNRWLHVQGVVRAAEYVGQTLSATNRAYLIAAAYLHDIGYAPTIVQTGFHPLDGAIFARALKEERLASLIAYHTSAKYEADLRSLTQQLNAFSPEHSATADALTFCDLITSPIGKRVSFKERTADIFQRYGPNSLISQALRQAMPGLQSTVTRTSKRLEQLNLQDIPN